MLAASSQVEESEAVTYAFARIEIPWAGIPLT